jgi:hypothetical protein
MKKGLFLILFLILNYSLFAQSEVGPEGNKLAWFLVLLIPLAVYFIIYWVRIKKTGKKKPLLKYTRVKIILDKDRLYFPDYLKLTINNTGNNDIDIDRPLLIFENFLMKRKFRLKGTNYNRFYPLYLVAGKTHTLQIDLNSFYNHDKKLIKYPKAKIIIFNVKGKRLGSQAVFLRKTLFR